MKTNLFSISFLLIVILPLINGRRPKTCREVLHRSHLPLPAINKDHYHHYENRIHDGHDAQTGEFPFQADILIGSHGHCTAALIHKKWVITAAHCVTGHSKETLLVYYLLVKRDDPYRDYYCRPVDDVFIHPKHLEDLIKYDVALLKVNREIRMDDIVHVLPALIRDDSNIPQGTHFDVIGWGRTDSPNDVLNKRTMQHSQMFKMNDKICASKFLDVKDLNEKFCATARISTFCYGDSGAPLVLHGTRELIGVLSAVITPEPNHSCSNNSMAVLVNITVVKNWIKESMKPDVLPSN